MQKYEHLQIVLNQTKYFELQQYLIEHGYQRSETVETYGQYNISGDRIVVWPVNKMKPYRLDFFGQNLEQIKDDQKTKHKVLTIKDNRLLTEDGVIRPQSYVVHPQFGIAQYVGRRIRQWQHRPKSFLTLLFAANDQLSFPQDREAELMPYYGKKNPRLTRLYSKAWQKTKQRISEDLYSIAKDLIVTAAKRAVVEREPYAENHEWQQIIAASFPHTLTKDQASSIADVTHDLIKERRPMDRLLTGDVGYGKTEVAIRAATTVLASGKKVILLAPTTVLVEQHYDVWSARFDQLPIKLAKVSRLNSQVDLTADCFIGTHKLFSANIPTAEIGLIIIDEEQRFGVKHKEHFKNLRSHLDVLSVTATPIPRTLYLGLAGLRNMSTIKTAPGQRRGVETVVRPYNGALIREAIVKERARGGQVYYIHNRVQSLPRVVRRLKENLKGVYRLSLEKRGKHTLRYAVAHGQTPIKKLADIMHRFFNNELDILISTSIVENGLDNPNANTLIIERAEIFGLADLYQLRGRVGRKDRTAYAYLLIGEREERQQRPLNLTALERLEIVADSAKLGSGWTIALKDLELRGAGTLLGKRQHGNLEAIGLVLYGRLLKRAVELVRQPSSSVHLTDDMLNLWKRSV